jgi:hypothetical protein
VRKTIRLSATSVFVIVFLSICAVWILFTVWQSNRISAQFGTLSRLAYRSVRECHDRVGEEDFLFSKCYETGQLLVIRVGQSAKTQHERRQYADLHSFLIDVREYHQKLLGSADPSQVRESGDNLNRFRDRLDQIFKSHSEDRQGDSE